MNDRLMIAAMAMQGMLASPDCIGDAQAVSGDAIECADALLAAAGEKDGPLHRGDMDDNLREWIETAMRFARNSETTHDLAVNRLERIQELESKLAACERERDRSQSFAEGLQAELTEAIDARNAAELALKRRLEPLSSEEAMEALGQVVTIHGLDIVERTIEACRICDRIRARRA